MLYHWLHLCPCMLLFLGSLPIWMSFFECLRKLSNCCLFSQSSLSLFLIFRMSFLKRSINLDFQHLDRLGAPPRQILGASLACLTRARKPWFAEFHSFIFTFQTQFIIHGGLLPFNVLHLLWKGFLVVEKPAESTKKQPAKLLIDGYQMFNLASQALRSGLVHLTSAAARTYVELRMGWLDEKLRNSLMPYHLFWTSFECQCLRNELHNMWKRSWKRPKVWNCINNSIKNRIFLRTRSKLQRIGAFSAKELSSLGRRNWVDFSRSPLLLEVLPPLVRCASAPCQYHFPTSEHVSQPPPSALEITGIVLQNVAKNSKNK